MRNGATVATREELRTEANMQEKSTSRMILETPRPRKGALHFGDGAQTFFGIIAALALGALGWFVLALLAAMVGG